METAVSKSRYILSTVLPSYVTAKSGVHFHHLFNTDLDGRVILRKSSGAFHSAQNSGSFDYKSNGTDHFGSALPECFGTSLKMVHFDQSGYFGRSN